MASSETSATDITKILPWSDGGREYLVLEKFASLRKRLETGLQCLTPEERAELRQLIKRRESELRSTGPAYLSPLHEKVSLLAGGNLVHLVVDAVVNASNQWLTSGKGTGTSFQLHSYTYTL